MILAKLYVVVRASISRMFPESWLCSSWKAIFSIQGTPFDDPEQRHITQENAVNWQLLAPCKIQYRLQSFNPILNSICIFSLINHVQAPQPIRPINLNLLVSSLVYGYAWCL